MSNLIIFTNLDYVGINWQEGWYQLNYIMIKTVDMLKIENNMW